MYTRNPLVEEAIRQMASELRAYERDRLAAAAKTLDSTVAWLEAQLGHSPTAATVAAALGITVEELLDLRSAPPQPHLASQRHHARLCAVQREPEFHVCRLTARDPA